jgi:hypothetical protein
MLLVSALHALANVFGFDCELTNSIFETPVGLVLLRLTGHR